MNWYHVLETCLGISCSVLFWSVLGLFAKKLNSLAKELKEFAEVVRERKRSRAPSIKDPPIHDPLDRN